MSPLDHQREPQIGALVLVRPSHPDVRIQRGATEYGKFIAPDGNVLPFDDFLRSRWLEGSVQLFGVEDAS